MRSLLVYISIMFIMAVNLFLGAAAWYIGNDADASSERRTQAEMRNLTTGHVFFKGSANVVQRNYLHRNQLFGSHSKIYQPTIEALEIKTHAELDIKLVGIISSREDVANQIALIETNQTEKILRIRKGSKIPNSQWLVRDIFDRKIVLVDEDKILIVSLY